MSKSKLKKGEIKIFKFWKQKVYCFCYASLDRGLFLYSLGIITGITDAYSEGKVCFVYKNMSALKKCSLYCVHLKGVLFIKIPRENHSNMGQFSALAKCPLFGMSALERFQYTIIPQK